MFFLLRQNAGGGLSGAPVAGVLLSVRHPFAGRLLRRRDLCGYLLHVHLHLHAAELRNTGKNHCNPACFPLDSQHSAVEGQWRPLVGASSSAISGRGFFLLQKLLLWLQIANGEAQNARTCGWNQLQLVAVRQRAAHCTETRSSRANEQRPMGDGAVPVSARS